ncbi:MAG: lysine 2,3-aminomutase [Bacteroidales bacterium]|nr:lysine 2,3-aminomutase [Bacteroidales bacterium]MCL2132721.1 lysine 2,3-aminomutase [Bacteroidales bacterium]
MKKYQSYTLQNWKQIPQAASIPAEDRRAIEVVGHVLPFKTNNYVIDELIQWSQLKDDPMFTLNFPRKEMLLPQHYREVEHLLYNGDTQSLKALVEKIRCELNPNPSGQEHNVPEFQGVRLHGLQHKYRETVLFFPRPGQTCHAYCTFCFRWPQFSSLPEKKFSMKEDYELYLKYIKAHPKVTDVLFTGGDPMVMSASLLRAYIEPMLSPTMKQIRHIRIGTKALAYWPYRFTTDEDADEILRLFDDIIHAGRRLSIMGHFNHPVELSTDAVKEAVRRIRNTGAHIRTQSPVLRHINDDPKIWEELLRRQVGLGCIPYYMFVARDTGAKHYFELPLAQCQTIFRKAYQKVSGICRTVRGPSMSDHAGKIQILGVSEAVGEKIFVLRFIQGRNPDWVARPFFAKYSSTATWFDQLKPAFGEKEFFFESELDNYVRDALERDSGAY